MTQLLVSVRSVAEAEAAIAGGAAVIDVKEPENGSLGRARVETIKAIADFAGPQRIVSAALGELLEEPGCPAVAGLTYVKWGLSGWGTSPGWQQGLVRAREVLREMMPACHLVIVAYADWRQARAPDPTELCRFACAGSFKAFLVDTWQKDSKTLVDWSTPGEILHLVAQCRAAGVRIALAGRLRASEIALLADLDPDWFAVRSSVCRRCAREQTIDPQAVRNLVDLLASSSRRPGPEVDSAYIKAGGSLREEAIDVSLPARLGPGQVRGDGDRFQENQLTGAEKPCHTSRDGIARDRPAMRQ